MFPILFASEPMLTARQAEDLSFQELAISSLSNKEKNKIPIWILNATVDVNNHLFRLQNMGDIPPIKQSNFEFTQFFYGNEFFGYASSDEYSSPISKAVQLSGAAVDSANPHNSYSSLFLSLVGGSLGDYANFKDTNVYLTDGGHSENLGAYSLVKRKVPIIVISDAEETEDGKPEGLILLREQLLKENKKLVLYDSYNFEVNRGGEPVRYYLPYAKAKTLLRHHDCHSNQNSNPLLTGEPLPTVLIGKICEKKESSDPDRCVQDEKEISTVFYIKARAIYKNFLKGKYLANNLAKEYREECDLGKSECYPQSVLKYLDEGNLENIDSCFTEGFPGTPTFDIFFKSYQFEANYAFG